MLLLHWMHKIMWTVSIVHTFLHYQSVALRNTYFLTIHMPELWLLGLGEV